MFGVKHMRIYFIRHSETECNRAHLFYGKMDVPINGRGREQAAKLGKLLENVNFDRIYASDMLRVQQTLKIVLEKNRAAREKSPEMIIWPAIREIDFGLWEGKTYAEIQKLFPEDVARWCDDWEHSVPTGGESFEHFYGHRIRDGFFDLVKDATAHGMQEKTILIAAHNGPMQGMFAAMLGLDIRGIWHFMFDQDAYSVVDFECDNFTVRKINSCEVCA